MLASLVIGVDRKLFSFRTVCPTSATITENEKRRTEKLRSVSTESCFLPHFDVVVFVPILTPRLQKVSREEGNKIGMKNKAQLCS